ncbi:hypothetical protein G6O69_11935 [Pseudenhygromyxa sp. WMMC2535]|uniref:hypothetical protein n=1 Tax=Pseudenhygromyxa sp. WMMC2535 TaxID=2712867 RepID=UPI00155220EA|nr:hypothetical protein [Pseudenhygromyxa sp. WMMC2535]NVB38542.1 hypothetical protein [Pseudenhygromyxa sp. WMMC2535]
MIRALIFGTSLALGATLGWLDLDGPPLDPPSEDQPRACCKICHEGKACGDSCIARTKDCTKAPGCACDARPPKPPAQPPSK